MASTRSAPASTSGVSGARGWYEMRFGIVGRACAPWSGGGYASTSVRPIAAPVDSVPRSCSITRQRRRAPPGGARSGQCRSLARYETRLANVSDLRALGAAMEELYSEDLRLGQLTAVQEIVGAMAFDPVLGDEIGRRMQPWVPLPSSSQPGSSLVATRGFSSSPAVIGSAVIALYNGARNRCADARG